MAGSASQHGKHPMNQFPYRAALRHAEVRVALIAAAALMVQAVIAKNVIDVQLDYISQNAALWVFIVFLIGGLRDRVAELAASAAIVVVTVAVLTFYAL